MELETTNMNNNKHLIINSSVDTSRPFRSVKEAVAVFGERILVGEIYSSPKSASSTTTQEIITTSSWKLIPTTPKERNDTINGNNGTSESSEVKILDALKKVKAELEETKAEVKLLKEKEQETEVALASLNAELHKNMSKLAQAEAAKAAKAAASKDMVSSVDHELQEEKIRRELRKRMEKNTTLAQILSLGLAENNIINNKDTTTTSSRTDDIINYSNIISSRKIRSSERKTVKKNKPIVPLLSDLFSWKKESPTTTTTTKYLYSAPARPAPQL